MGSSLKKWKHTQKIYLLLFIILKKKIEKKYNTKLIFSIDTEKLTLTLRVDISLIPLLQVRDKYFVVGCKAIQA